MKDTELIGQEKNYKITSIMPEGIEDYKRLEFTDKLSKGLTYAGGFNLKVHRGGTELPAINGKYDSNIPAEGTKNATINVKFKPEGIKLLKKGDKIVIKYKAKINEDAILGGAKVSDKIAVIENLLEKADKVIIGGGMAYTFMKAQGKEIGISLCENDKIEYARELMAKAGDKLVLPIDTVVAKEFSNDAPSRVAAGDIQPDEEGLDIGPKSVELFKKTLEGAKTVIWNGPMGVFEMPNFAKGTIGVCEAIANLEGATTIIGGGDSATAAISLGYAEKFSHISTGGGASLEYLEGKVLPGIDSLSNK